MTRTNHSSLKALSAKVYSRSSSHNLSLVAAGVAFYAFLSVFPALATVVSIYGLLADAQTVQQNINQIGGVVPPDVKDIMTSRLQDIASNQQSSLTVGLILGVVVSLWSANKAMKAAAQALNVAFDENEDRSFMVFNLVTLSLTLVSSIVVIVALSTIVFMPLVISTFLSLVSVKLLTALLSWGLLVLLLTGMFLVFYRYAPSREYRPVLKKSLPGALFSTVLFVLASLAFSFYVSNFGKFDEQYGTIGAVVVTMLWLYMGSYIFLLGAEINAARNSARSD